MSAATGNAVFHQCYFGQCKTDAPYNSKGVTSSAPANGHGTSISGITIDYYGKCETKPAFYWLQDQVVRSAGTEK